MKTALLGVRRLLYRSSLSTSPTNVFQAGSLPVSCNVSSASSSFSTSTHTSPSLTHVTADNLPTMVDVSEKAVTTREATAQCFVLLPPPIAALVQQQHTKGASSASPSSPVSTSSSHGANTGVLEISSKKGPVITTAIIAGTMAVKQTSNLIPFCHPLPIESCKIHIEAAATTTTGAPSTSASSSIIHSTYSAKPDVAVVPALDWSALKVSCKVRVTHKTGVEMEALTGCSVAALTIYDMLKALSHDIIITNTMLVSKTGGKSAYDIKPRKL